MLAAVIVLGVILAALVVLFVCLYLYTRTDAWRTSDLRMSTMRFLVIIGPFFGARVDPPPPDIPTVSTPKADDGDAGPGLRLHDRDGPHEE